NYKVQETDQNAISGASTKSTVEPVSSPTPEGTWCCYSSEGRRFYLGADRLGHPAGLLQRPLLVTTGAKTANPAGRRHEELLAALGASDPGKPMPEVAALEELPHERPDVRSPEAIPLLVAFLVHRFELRVEALDRPVEWRLLRVPGTINAADLFGPAG